jgi:hypothetical protein
MAERRINTETGVIEENTGFIFDNWTAVENGNGNEERVNPGTGVIEENTGFIFDSWTSKG